mmetsp:Transcript_158333/g.303847  ORF Transcript_158333/g.303847 Transcript_158333/m.303847 type:complete len:147 (-) Transcript_158333:41-481(-)
MTLIPVLLWLLSASLGTLALDLEWTSYSDRADLPMSQQWRDEMKARLAKIDTTKLSAEQKRKFKKLWSRLDGSPDTDGGMDMSFAPLLVVGGLAAAFWWYNSQQQGSGPSAASGTPTPIPVNTGREGSAMAAEAREARLRRFAGEQ